MRIKNHLLAGLAAVLMLAAPSNRAQSSAPPVEGGAIRVACVGDSITYGANINNRERNCYPAQMQRLLGDGYVVRNFGVNSRTMLKHGDYPYWSDPAHAQALAFQPNIVVIALGGNDSKPQNWKYRDEFAADARAMIDSFRALPGPPRILLSLPLPAFKVMWGINDDIYNRELIPVLREVAFETHTELIEMHTAFLNKEPWFPDYIHPNADGAALMAKIIGGVLAFKSDPGFDLGKNLAAQGITTRLSSFYGYRQLDFAMDDGRQCTVVQPFVAAAGHPYAWRGEFFGHEPQTDLALLDHGYHVVYVGAQDMYGSPPAMEIWEKFHALLAKAGLDGKIALIGMSRGGLYCYHWAALHPETVSVLYGDAPVCDFKSWPGGQERTTTYINEWATLMKLYGFANEAEAFAYKLNPVDNLEPLAKAHIPIIHVVGQADTDVPVQDNTDEVEQRYLKLKGNIEVIRKPGAAHHPHSLPNPEPIVDFILSHQK
jgi:lysophospholipase L1-like esterase/pimeloyl-ACP methyl ester carboxylesterase